MLKYFENIYEALVLVGSWLKSPIMFFIRWYWGWLFAIAGWDKLVNINSFAQSLEAFGFTPAYFHSYLVAYSELIGGACLIFGFASRLVALLSSVIVIVVYATLPLESLKNVVLSSSITSADVSIAFLLAMLTVVAFGPGRYSVDYLLERELLKKHKHHYDH